MNRLDYEYKKHLKNSYLNNLVRGGVCLLLNIVILLASNMLLAPLSDNIRSISCMDSSYIESNQYYAEYKTECLFENLVSVSNESGVTHNTNVYVEIPENRPIDSRLDSESLESDEIIITENIAKSLNVSEGDILYLDFLFATDKKAYTIVRILPNTWNYFDLLDNYDFSLVHIGYDNELISNSSFRYVYSLNADDYESFFNNQYSYTKQHNTENEIKQLNQALTIIVIIEGIALLAVNLPLLWYSHARMIAESLKYHRNGYSKYDVKRIHFRDTALFCFSPILASIIFDAILSFKTSISLMLLLVFFVVFVLMIVFVRRGVELYGRSA